jgi:hypothetical protein
LQQWVAHKKRSQEQTMADYRQLNQQHLAYLHQQGLSAIAHQVQHLVRQDLDQHQQRQAALLQAALEAHLLRPRSTRQRHQYSMLLL